MPVLPWSPTASERLASVADVAAYLGQPIDDDDASALLALDLATALIQSETRQTLVRATSTVALRGDRRFLVLPERPVVDVAAVDGDELPEYVRLGEVLMANYGFWPTTVSVTYTHGFDPIPNDLRAICVSAAARQLVNPQALRSEDVGGMTTVYGDSGGLALTDAERGVALRYRRRVYS